MFRHLNRYGEVKPLFKIESLFREIYYVDLFLRNYRLGAQNPGTFESLNFSCPMLLGS